MQLSWRLNNVSDKKNFISTRNLGGHRSLKKLKIISPFTLDNGKNQVIISQQNVYLTKDLFIPEKTFVKL